MYREYCKGPFGYGFCLRSTAFITGENCQRVRYRIEQQQLISDFQTHVKKLSQNRQSFSGLISPPTVYKSVTGIYMVGAGDFVKCDVVSEVFP